MKVTTEKLPNSLLAVNIELDREQVEKGLDRAARRLSQKVNIPGFRKGKAPRFIVENYFGRAALIEEASEDLVNKAFKDALEQEQITPVGQANLAEASFDIEPFHFRVIVPVPPTVTLPDYRAIRAPFETREVTDEMLARAMDSRRERHVVLREPEEQRAAQAGDQLTVRLESFLGDEPLDEREEGSEVPETTIILEPDRLAPGMFEGLLGIAPGETREITSHMPEDHANERVRDQDVTFKVTLERVQERLLPDWDELPVLEEFEGTLDELREKTRTELAETLRNSEERETVDTYIKQLISQTEYDIPDALITQEADELLHQQGHQFERYGITLEQMLQYRGQTHDQAVEELKPQAEEQLKTTLALREVIRAEGLSVNEAEIDAELADILNNYEEEQRERARTLLTTQLRSTVASSAFDKKLRAHLLTIATGGAPNFETQPAAEPEASPTPATQLQETAPDEQSREVPVITEAEE